MGSIFKIIGSIVLFASFVLVGFIYYPVFIEEVRYQAQLIRSSAEEKEIIPASREFGLVIPKIRANAKVFANVDPHNPKEYLPILTKGVAHAAGSVFPGDEGNVFIFAHSRDTPFNITRYNVIFYLINKLEPDDEIVVYFLEKEYLYKVVDKITSPPEFVAEHLGYLTGKSLTLQTCTPPGTAINRLLVIAEEVD